MNRTTTIAVFLIVLLLGVLLYFSSSSKKKNDYVKWQFNYEYDNQKLAYDRDFFIDFIKTDVGPSNFEKLDERLSRQDELDSNSLYLYYNQSFSIDKTETDALMDFVKEGNSAVIIAEEFSRELFKSLRGVQIKYDTVVHNTINYPYDSARYINESVTLFTNKNVPIDFTVFGYANPFNIQFLVDTNDISDDYYAQKPTEVYEIEYDEDDYIDDEDYYSDNDEESYSSDEAFGEFDDENHEVTEIELDETALDFTTPVDVTIEVIGKTKRNGNNALKIKYGKGYIYLHCTPGLFTNYQLDKPEVFGYLQRLFNDIDYQHVYWDRLRFQFLNNTGANGQTMEDQSYFQYIYKNKALKTAFYFCLTGILIFLIVGIKRKYNTIEVVDPVTNSSIEFTKTIARLYWLNPNHKRMAEQKMKMFLFEVRNRYGLVTHELGEEFRQKFQAKCGVPEKHIRRLFDAYDQTLKKAVIHEDILIQISDEIGNIKQLWK